MCLAIPGKITSVEGKKAKADFGGIKRTIDLSFLEDAKIDDWVLVHVGFAIQTVDEESAFETYHLLADVHKKDMEDEINNMAN